MSHDAGIKTDVMIDLETTGTSAGCAILSIGAAPFNTYKVKPFYETISLQSCTELGLTESDSTLAWWSLQPNPTREEAFSGIAPLKDVLQRFSAYLAEVEGEPVMWGNAASFDIKVLETAYHLCDLPVPWSYKNEMCYRTLKNLFPQIKPTLFMGIKHNALSDAQHQARHAELIFDYLHKLETGD